MSNVHNLKSKCFTIFLASHMNHQACGWREVELCMHRALLNIAYFPTLPEDK